MEGRLEKAQTELKSEILNAQLAREQRLEKAQTELKSEILNAQTELKSEIRNAQTEFKSEIRNAQLAQELRLEKAQTEYRIELGKNIDSNNYKLLFMISGIMFASLAVFESVGIFIEYPWRSSPRATRS